MYGLSEGCESIQNMHTVLLQLYDILEKIKYGDSKINQCVGLAGRKNASADMGILGQRNYYLCYYKSRYNSLYFFQTHGM